MSTIPPGFGPSAPGYDTSWDAPPTFYMDAVAQLRHDQQVGYSSLDPSTLGTGDSGLADLLREIIAERRGASGGFPSQPPRPTHPISGSAGMSGASASGEINVREGTTRSGPGSSARARAEAKLEAAIELAEAQAEARAKSGSSPRLGEAAGHGIEPPRSSS